MNGLFHGLVDDAGLFPPTSLSMTEAIERYQGTLAAASPVLTHRFLLREVWGPHASQENHYLRVFVAGLRRKLGDDPARSRYIATDQGVGYRFAAE